MSTKPKESTEPQLVWQVTAENPDGELLELVPKGAPEEKSSSRRVVWTRVPSSLPNGPLSARGTEAPATEAAPPVVASAARKEHSTSWRASSWDLLNGLVVRDVSDKIPPRTFEALFSANDDAEGAPGRKQR